MLITPPSRQRSAEMDEASSPLLELLSTPSVMGLLLMLSIIFNAILMIWCTKGK